MATLPTRHIRCFLRSVEASCGDDFCAEETSTITCSASPCMGSGICFLVHSMPQCLRCLPLDKRDVKLDYRDWCQQVVVSGDGMGALKVWSLDEWEYRRQIALFSLETLSVVPKGEIQRRRHAPCVFRAEYCDHCDHRARSGSYRLHPGGVACL